MKWTIEYSNDVNGGFWEWWEVHYEGQKVFQANKKEDAKNLADLLNMVHADRNLDIDVYII